MARRRQQAWKLLECEWKRREQEYQARAGMFLRPRSACLWSILLENGVIGTTHSNCSDRLLNQTGRDHDDSARQFATVFFENVCRPCGFNNPRGWFESGAITRSRRTTARLCRNLQLSAPRCVADPGGSAAGQWSRNSPLSRKSRHRGDDDRWHPRNGNEPELPGFE
jgi:hypothetical protein